MNEMEQTTRSVTDEPGALRGTASIVLHTSKAKSMVQGRRPTDTKPAIKGLLRFASDVRAIWQAARGDDPWADAWLIRVEDEITRVQRELLDLTNQVSQALSKRPGVRVGVGQSAEPVEVPLDFGAPHAYSVAWLLGDFDELARGCLTAKHCALMTPTQAERLMGLGGRAVRRVLESTKGYRFMAVCREDVRQNTQRAQKAVEAMGELPEEIITGERRPEFAPAVDELAPRPRRATPTPRRRRSPSEEPVTSDGDAPAEREHQP